MLPANVCFLIDGQKERKKGQIYFVQFDTTDMEVEAVEGVEQKKRSEKGTTENAV